MRESTKPPFLVPGATTLSVDITDLAIVPATPVSSVAYSVANTLPLAVTVTPNLATRALSVASAAVVYLANVLPTKQDVTSTSASSRPALLISTFFFFVIVNFLLSDFGKAVSRRSPL